MKNISNFAILSLKVFDLLNPYKNFNKKIKTNIEIVKDGPTTAVIDGHNGMGQVIAKKSMALAIEKAKKMGLGMVSVRNSTHYGIAGYYALMAIKEGMIGITGKEELGLNQYKFPFE